MGRISIEPAIKNPSRGIGMKSGKIGFWAKAESMMPIKKKGERMSLVTGFIGRVGLWLMASEPCYLTDPKPS